MNLKIGIKVDGKWYGRVLAAKNFTAAQTESEQLFTAYPKATEMEIYEENLYGSHGKWVYFTYRGGWSSMKYPPSKTADCW